MIYMEYILYMMYNILSYICNRSYILHEIYNNGLAAAEGGRQPVVMDAGAEGARVINNALSVAYCILQILHMI